MVKRATAYNVQGIRVPVYRSIDGKQAIVTEIVLIILNANLSFLPEMNHC